MSQASSSENKEIFNKLKNDLLNVDPVYWAENHLMLDGKPFRVHGNGYKPFCDIYRYMGIKALEPTAKPLIIVAGRQVGKDLDINTPIPTPSGWKTMADLQVGDKVFDENGDTCDITWVSPIFTDHKCYELTFDDGAKIVAGEDHQWLTHTKSDRKPIQRARVKSIPTIKNTQQIHDTLKTNTSKRESNHSIPISGAVKYEHKELPIEPYVLGCWLGDGFSNTSKIECADDEIISEIRKYYPVSLTYRSKNTKSYAYRIGELLKGDNGRIYCFTKKLVQLKLRYNKHIPDIYLHSDIDQRMALLQGLMDTDGCCNKNGKQEFCSSNKLLATQTLELIKSLGIKAKMTESDATLYGRVVNKRYRIYLNTDMPIFRLTRKLKYISGKCNLKTTHRYIVDSKLVDTVPTKCISVNSPSNLYLASKSFISTHNTTLLSVLEMYFMGSGIFGNGINPPVRMIHAFPHLELAAAYSKTKLNQMISSAAPAENQSDKKSAKQKSCMQVLLDQTTATNDSLHFKQFSGGNHLWIESTGLDADRIMGRSCDIIAFDEIQKTTAHAIGNALKILTTAKWGRPSKGVQVYVGTPRRKGSDFHKLWLRSSQQYFYLGCEQCKEYFPLYTPGSDDWKNIWIYGKVVKCPKCGHEQDKLDAQERGKWIAIKDPNDPDCDMIGFHVSQIYMPMFTREDIINEMPGIHPLNTERTFMNEVLGEFFQGDSSPITPEEIRENCADVGRKFRARIDSSNEEDKDQLVVMGIDYGAKSDMEQMANPERSVNRGQSYSTAVILTAKGAGRLSIEFCTKFKRNDMESKKGLIDQLMRQYSVQLTVGDIGFSQDFSEMLHSSYGDRYLVSRAHNKVNGRIKFSIDAFPKEIVFERDHYIGELYEQMKKGMIRFPFGDYEKIAWLIEHCASMEIKPSISRGGDPSIHYIKGGTPNDGMMALLNAYIAYKFLLTNGFTNNNPLLHQQDFKQANKPLVMTGIISRRI